MSRSLFDRLLLYIALAILGSFVLAAGVGTFKRARGEVLAAPSEQRADSEGEAPIAVQQSAGAARAPASATPSPRATRRPTRTPSVTPTATATPSPRPTRTPRATRTTEAMTPSPEPSPTTHATRTPRPSPTRSTPPTPIASAHDWLARPIAPPGDDHVAHFYPYGGTAENTLQIHHGVEMVNPTGTQVIAAADGTVVFAGPDDSVALGPTTDFYGNVVVVRHDQQWLGKDVYTLYAHLDSIQVAEEQRVKQGDSIGLVGMTGIALGPHLHFEVRVGENTYAATRNPELWLPAHPGNGTIAGRVLDEQGQLVPLAFVTVQHPDERIYRTATSYPNTEVNSDEELGENLVIGDIPAGRWLVAARVGDRIAVDEVTVRAGETTWAHLQPRP